jgi:hypothetical protein
MQDWGLSLGPQINVPLKNNTREALCVKVSSTRRKASVAADKGIGIRIFTVGQE